MWSYDDARAAVRDALRLSRAMTFKAAVAGLPLGGGKGVIMLPRRRRRCRRRAPPRRAAGLRRHRRGARRRATSPPRTSAPRAATWRSIAARARRTSPGCRAARGGSGDPSPWTALGVEAAMRVACERAFGSDVAARPQRRRPRPRPRRRARGRGCCAQARRASSSSPTSTRPSARWPTALGARWVDAGEALRAEVDVLAPVRAGRRARPRRASPALRLPRRSPARPTTSSPTDDIGALLAARGDPLGARTSSPTPAASSTSRSSSSPAATTPAARATRVRGDRRHVRADLRRTPSRDDTPLAAAMRLAEARLSRGRAAVRRRGPGG